MEAVAVTRAPIRAIRAPKNGIDKATTTHKATNVVLNKILNDFLFWVLHLIWEPTLSCGGISFSNMPETSMDEL